MKRTLLFLLTASMALFAPACGEPPNTEATVAAVVALTQTAFAPAVPPEAAAALPTGSQPTAAATAAVQAAKPFPASEAVRVTFAPNATSWYTNGDLAAGASAGYILTAMKGQLMSVWLSTEPAGEPANLTATLEVTGADGQKFTIAPGAYWSSVLPANQDYIVEVRSLAQHDISYQIVIEIPAAVIDPARGAMYEPIAGGLCQDLQAAASQALGVEFSLQSPAPFLDSLGGEAGQGCRLGAFGSGAQFQSPQDIITTLSNSAVSGWNPVSNYRADGPTGSLMGFSRDMGLMLITASWKPAPGAVCPADQPITLCNLTPEQKHYTIEIQAAQYRATFSLDGHWEDAAAGFSLDLYQDWKTIHGRHSAVAQGGNKIDALDVSINGMLKGQTATVEFQSSFTTDTGTAELTYIDVHTMLWRIIDPPEGEYYLPAEARLVRQ